MDDESESIWKETVVTYLTIIPHNFPAGYDEGDVQPQSEKAVSGPRFKPGTFRKPTAFPAPLSRS
jgi:hypothetical protein